MNSSWFKQYVAEREAADAAEKKAADKEARKKLIVLPIVFTIMCGGMIAAMISNGNTAGVPVIGVIYAVLMLMSIVLISKKKGAPTSLDLLKEKVQKYVTTEELEKALDAEMTAEPIEGCSKQGNAGLFFTKSFLVKRFTDNSVLLAPYSAIKYKSWGKDAGDYIVDFYDGSKKFIFGLMCTKAEQAEVDELLKKYIPDIKKK